MDPTLETTGERYAPWWTAFDTGYEHVHRYLLAVPYARAKRVLDVASGEGYGTALLAQVAAGVIGVEIHGPAIAHAKQRHGRPNTGFVRADAERLALRPGSFDLVVSFETLEHLEDQQAFIDAVKTCLRPDGILLISTPNCAVFSRGSRHGNPYHKRELFREEFLDLLHGAFRHVRLLGQRCLAVSVVAESVGEQFMAPDDPCAPLFTEFRADQLDYPIIAESQVRPMYFVAVCSDRPLPKPSGSMLIDQERVLWKRFAQQQRAATLLASLLEQTRQRLAEAEAQLAEARRRLP